MVGKIVKLKVDCLGNKAGTLGVVFHDYGDGYQAIFENGNYDGFSTVHKMPNGQVEADYFLDVIGYDSGELTTRCATAGYKFKNVMQVSLDYESGIFDHIWKNKEDK
jgi:hypothetical protein